MFPDGQQGYRGKWDCSSCSAQTHKASPGSHQSSDSLSPSCLLTSSFLFPSQETWICILFSRNIKLKKTVIIIQLIFSLTYLFSGHMGNLMDFTSVLNLDNIMIRMIRWVIILTLLSLTLASIQVNRSRELLVSSATFIKGLIVNKIQKKLKRYQRA